MIQEQLTEYISAQMKLGVSQDAIKAALVGAGWVAGDVDDTFKKMSGVGSAPLGASQPAKPISSISPSPTAPGIQTMGGLKPQEKIAEPQTIRVSDLISAKSAITPINSVSTVAPAKAAAATSPVQSQSFFKNLTPSAVVATEGPKKHGVMSIVAIVVILILAGLAGYFYFENVSLMGQVGGLNTQSESVTSQISGLQSQVTALNASDTALAAQASSLETQNQDLMMNLSFLVVPPSAGSSTAPTSVTVSGLISGGKPTFVLTTDYGVKAYVKNSSDTGVRSALTPFVGGTSSVQLSGTYIPGSSIITVTAVNGNSIVQATSTTATD